MVSLEDQSHWNFTTAQWSNWVSTPFSSCFPFIQTIIYTISFSYEDRVTQISLVLEFCLFFADALGNFVWVIPDKSARQPLGFAEIFESPIYFWLSNWKRSPFYFNSLITMRIVSESRWFFIVTTFLLCLVTEKQLIDRFIVLISIPLDFRFELGFVNFRWRGSS